MTKSKINIGKLISDGAVDKKAVSGPETINEFFEDLFPPAKDAWPFDFSKEGYITSYQSTDFDIKQAGLVKYLVLEMKAKKEQDEYFIKAKIMMDCEKVAINLENLYRSQGSKANNFGNIYMGKLKAFIDAQDKARGKNFDASELLFEAASRNDKSGVAVCGGYVWANQGGDFLDKEELEDARVHFKSFAAQNGVEISDKDLSIFTKPCHFAAFNCGVRVKNKLGKDSSLGKAFLYLHSWQGHVVASPYKSEKPEEQRYAEAYNNPNFTLPCRKRMALLQLSASYRKMLKKYRNIHSITQKANPVKLYARATKMQFSKMLNRL